MTPVSIVIIAHKNNITLKTTLNSVDRFARPGDQKILVLNNASSDVIQTSNELGPDWKIAFESKPGPQHARNKGIESADHKYLVFLDDDIQLTQGWIEEMLSHFNSPWVAAGQSFIKFEKHDSIYWNYLRFTNLAHLSQFLRPSMKVPTMDTAAVMIKKSWLESLGGFHADLSYVEDTELSMRIHFNNGRIFFTTKAEAIQTFNPRESFLDTLRKTISYAPNLMMYRKLLKQPNIIEFSPVSENFRFRKKIYWRNFIFIAFDVTKFIFREVCCTPLRDALIPQAKLPTKMNLSRTEKKKVGLVSDSGSTTT